MKVVLQPHATNPRMFLSPEDEAEEAILRVIVDHYKTASVSSQWLSGIKEVGIELTPLDGEPDYQIPPD